MGSSSPAGLTAAMRSPLGVVIDGDLTGPGQGLTGQNVASVDLALFQCVVAAHGRLACDDLRTAGAAYASFTGERQIRPDLLGAVEHRRAGRQEQRRAAPVEDDGQAGAICSTGAHWRVVVDRLGGRLVADPEQLAGGPGGDGAN